MANEPGQTSVVYVQYSASARAALVTSVGKLVVMHVVVRCVVCRRRYLGHLLDVNRLRY